MPRVVGVADATNIHVPAPLDTSRPTIVSRDALVDLLDRATEKRVTVITAPPGSGKSMLLSSWLERSSDPKRFASVAVRRGEADPQRFWLSVIRAIRLAVDPEGAAEALTPTPEFDGGATLDRALDELGASGEPSIVVIDDLQELRSPEALGQLQEFIDRLPPTARLVLAARSDPDLRLHQLRLEGQLSEIRGVDLKMTVGEAKAMLDASGIVLSDELAGRLHERTEGWAAGLRLAAISLEGRPDPEAFVSAFSGSDRTVADYLVSEMLERLPPTVRGLLLRTSILDRVTVRWRIC